MSFVFFDTETTGLKKGFDQIIDFAAVQTDIDLNEIDRFQVRSRLLPHVLPHPSALLANGLSIEQLTDVNLPSHYTMMQEVHERLLEWSPAIFIGFNSLRFDEEMLRHALFQSLLPPYLTSKHTNGRADALSLIKAVDAITPNQLVIPLDAQGRSVFGLVALAEANGVADHQAHDALSDTLTTIELCRLVHQRSPELWQRFVRFSKKATVAEFIKAEDGFLLTEFFSGQAHHTPVVHIGRDPTQSNMELCLALGGDVEKLIVMSEDDLGVCLTGTFSPVRRVRVNAAPTLAALYDAPEHLFNADSIGEIESQARRVKEDEVLCARLVAAHVATLKPYPVSPHLEKRIYDGFPGTEDENRMAAFHLAPWIERVGIVQSLEDERLRWFGLRLIYAEARSVLPPLLRTEVERRLAEQLTGDGTGGLTYEQAIAETNKLLQTSPKDAGLLSAYYQYLHERRSRATTFCAKHAT